MTVLGNLLILMIEDDPVVLGFHRAMLVEGGFSVHSASTLRRGLFMLGTSDYDAVLLDLNLPDSNGMNALNVLRYMRPRLPIVVLTGVVTQEMEEAMRNGADDFLQKPSTKQELVDAIRKAVIRRQVDAVFAPAEEGRKSTEREIEAFQRMEREPNGIGS